MVSQAATATLVHVGYIGLDESVLQSAGYLPLQGGFVILAEMS